jgi:hypothetical protein
MTSFAAPPQARKPTREEALAVASKRKAARRLRTARIRKAVAILAVAAFLGPFAVIYGQVAAGEDPALSASTSQSATSASESTSANGSGSTTGSASNASSGSTSGGSTSSASTSSPAPVTTQQS